MPCRWSWWRARFLCCCCCCSVASTISSAASRQLLIIGPHVSGDRGACGGFGRFFGDGVLEVTRDDEPTPAGGCGIVMRGDWGTGSMERMGTERTGNSERSSAFVTTPAGMDDCLGSLDRERDRDRDRERDLERDRERLPSAPRW